ncbi:MAG: c-type cytochrome [Acidimicrobiales bacterium]
MINAAAMFATVYRTIGLVLMVVVLAVFVAYVIVNVRWTGKPELGSELEVAANRKPYYDDETLEGPKLDKSLTVGLLTLVVLAVGLPFYWIMEPARQENAAGNFNRQFTERGEAMFAPTGDNLQALNCAGCHGSEGVGGVAPFNRTLPNGDIEPVEWRAPALNTVLLRHSREEVTFILTFGRPGTPMPAWGVEGGGPLNEQQVQNLVDYLESIQLSPDEAQQQAQEALDAAMALNADDGRPLFGSEGEALFNLGLVQSDATDVSCSRCHTNGWSFFELETVGTEEVDGQEQSIYSRESYDEIAEISGCGGAFAPNLCDGATERQFPEEADHVTFITDGSENGIGYGVTGQGDGLMPGFGFRPQEEALWWINGGQARDPSPGVLTAEMIEAIVDYERDL